MVVELKTQILSAGERTGEELTVLGRYQIHETLGKGGMGLVYRALHLNLGKTVAIKLLLQDCLQSEESVERFYREMCAIGVLDHPNVVRSIDGGNFDGAHCLVMEYIDGCDLAHCVRQNGPLSVPDACEVVRQSSLGLQYIHEMGFVHRDVKPSNLMLSRDGTVKILDLGLAKLRSGSATNSDITSTGVILGTFDYTAPEQIAESKDVDNRADIYSLGCTLYCLLCGQPPFGRLGNNLAKKIVAHSEQQAVPIQQIRAGIPVEVSVLLEKMLAKDRNERPSSAELIEVVSEFAASANPKRLFLTSRRTHDSKLTSVPDSVSNLSHLMETDTYAKTPNAADRPPRVDAVKHQNATLNRHYGLSLVTCIVVAASFAALIWFHANNQTKKPNTEPSTHTPISTGNKEFTAADKLVSSDSTTSRSNIHESNALGIGIKELVFPQDQEISSWRMLDSSNAVQVYTEGYSLLAIEQRSSKAELQLSIDIQQPKWSGGIGVFYGFRYEYIDGRRQAMYRSVEIHRLVDGDYALNHYERRFNVSSPQSQESLLLSGKPISEFNGHKVALSITVRNGELEMVSLNEKQIALVEADSRKVQTDRESIAREFGIYCQKSIGTFSNITINGANTQLSIHK